MAAGTAGAAVRGEDAGAAGRSRREVATQRLWAALYRLFDDERRAALDGLLEVPEGQREFAAGQAASPAGAGVGSGDGRCA
ncbi:hypothetical protein [Saccharopolyspora sp. ASAGF58]|uniref:hypothetical protein n=1 Tax=Saccharopolyspora sp. ASAGF58 TaxID=2719023 RepID=UPI001B3183D3|nr:hypothetical protein [Saccharopolyspora sp. ASAGF58]